MTELTWPAFAHPQRKFAYAGAALHKNWGRLHRADLEPYPDAQQAAALVRSLPAPLPAGGDPDKLAAALQQAWRLFHQGRFEEAARQAEQLGVAGYALANKATGIHAAYLEPDAAKRQALYQQTARRAEAAVAALPGHANSHYSLAYALGRYSQGIPILQALAEGHAIRIRRALDATLKLEPRHAEAHIALGTYHAEIVGKVGGMMAALTYGVSADASIGHYRKALELAPESAIARVEYADALRKLHGRSRADEARRLLTEAAAVEPLDAMQWLDVEAAKSRLAGA